MRIRLAKPRGFCAGVDRAVAIVEMALKVFGPPVYVRHEIVHNANVVKNLLRKGAVFVDEIREIPEGSVVIYSAHGVAPEVRREAESRRLKSIDATCPLVTKVHLEALRFSSEGVEILLIGHSGHPEVEGTMGQVPGRITLVEDADDARSVEVRDPRHVAILTQTTLSVDDTKDIVAELRRRFPGIQEPSKDDICYATQNRQEAVKELAREADVILVIGAQNSSNANRLREVAEREGRRAYLVDSYESVRREWLEGAATIGVTSGASTPEYLVKELIDHLKTLGATSVDELVTTEESVHFPLPEIATDALSAKSEVQSSKSERQGS